MRLNLTTTHDILVSFVQAPSECPKAKKARADRDFHSPLIPPLNVKSRARPAKRGTAGSDDWYGCLAAGGLCPATQTAGAQVAGAGAHSLTRAACPSLAAAFSPSGTSASGGPRGGGHIDREAALAGGRSVQTHRWLTRHKQAVLSRCLLRSEADIALFGGDPDRPSSISARDPSLAPEFESTQPSG